MIHHGNCLEILKTLDANSIDSIVTDPPYGLSFMGKKWDYNVPSMEIWKEALRVLKPGGHLLAFGGTRTYHRLVVNIEDAGFEIRDQIQWLYGSGFPKSHNIKEGEFKGWGTALKPANEPICLARKPLEGTVAQNVSEYGTGALNIDASRIESADQEKFAKNWDREKLTDMRGGNYGNGKASGIENTISAPLGRWPANIILDEEAAAVLDEQSGNVKSAGKYKSPDTAKEGGNGIFAGGRITNAYAGEHGGASRFFYVAKASKRERNAGLEGMARKQKYSLETSKSGAHDCFTYGDKNPCVPQANNHPTVKPIKLMEYLIKLITPPKGIVLDPFMGSGSTGVAAKKLGFEFIGIEMQKDYVEISEKRIAHGQGI